MSLDKFTVEQIMRCSLRPRRTFDPKCSTLAAAFLSDHQALDTPRNQDALAYEIQQVIDNWIAEAADAIVAD